MQVLRRNCSDPTVHFEILSNPEFLAEGTAMADLENPDRVSTATCPAVAPVLSVWVCVCLWRTLMRFVRITPVLIGEQSLHCYMALGILAGIATAAKQAQTNGCCCPNRRC